MNSQYQSCHEADQNPDENPGRHPVFSTLHAGILDLPAGGSYPFSITTLAGGEGKVIVTGKVSRDSTVLVEVADQYKVDSP